MRGKAKHSAADRDRTDRNGTSVAGPATDRMRQRRHEERRPAGRSDRLHRGRSGGRRARHPHRPQRPPDHQPGRRQLLHPGDAGECGHPQPGLSAGADRGSQRRGWIAGFEASVLLTDANRNTVTGLESYDGITLVRSHKATITNSYLSSDWLGCDPLTSPAGLRLIDSDRATIRANAAHLGGLGMVLVRSHNNLLQGNESAPNGSDGSGCSGIVLIDADGNRLIGNTTSQNYWRRHFRRRGQPADRHRRQPCRVQHRRRHRHQESDDHGAQHDERREPRSRDRVGARSHGRQQPRQPQRQSPAVRERGVQRVS